MNAVIIEHVKISELPAAWRAKLPAPDNARVTVRIEEETSGVETEKDLLFGMWRDREDMADVEVYMSKLRAPRF
ncbi:MAG: hypothetical protein NTX45_28225 [Proteobacteria bacterium]|nr:hypothetical protein [Pseudomonadota bacterium]